MFEDSKPFNSALSLNGRGDWAGDARTGEPAEADGLRSVDWAELRARLGAARELRGVLQAEAKRCNPQKHRDFSEAAARYFGQKTDQQRPVNPVALEPGKRPTTIMTPCTPLVHPFHRSESVDDPFEGQEPQDLTASADARDEI